MTRWRNIKQTLQQTIDHGGTYVSLKVLSWRFRLQYWQICSVLIINLAVVCLQFCLSYWSVSARDVMFILGGIFPSACCNGNFFKKDVWQSCVPFVALNFKTVTHGEVNLGPSYVDDEVPPLVAKVTAKIWSAPFLPKDQIPIVMRLIERHIFMWNVLWNIWVSTKEKCRTKFWQSQNIVLIFGKPKQTFELN